MGSFPDFHHDQKAIQAHLIHGRELANQLRLTLENPLPYPAAAAAAAAADDDDDGRLVAADDLLTKIFQSFSETISLLSREKTNDVSRIPDCVQVASSCLEGQRSEDSEESSRTSALKNDRRGCYNKRRRNSQILTRVTSDLIDDGHGWRKYGQKTILNAKHPRNYYRCTHKFDQGCQATKQVQKINDDDGPAKYRITYHCQHTCKKLVNPPKVILDSDYHFPVGETLNSRFLSFGKINPNNYYPNNALHDHDDSVISQTFPPSLIKQRAEEYYRGEKEKPNLYDVNYNQSPSSSDYFLCPDLMRLEYSSGLTDHGDVISSSGMYSCTTSTHSHGLDMDMDLIAGSGDFHDDVSQYEFCF